MHQLEVQVRPLAATRVAQGCEHGAPLHALPDLDADGIIMGVGGDPAARMG